jgi:UDP-N-acetylglucosamine/UDP-N-acetylgalactosamine 4-epimerase
MRSRYDQVCEDLVNKPRRWLVTGVAGFIGSALLERLLDLGQSVVGIDNFLNGSQKNIDDVLAIYPDAKLQFQFVEGDLRDLATAHKVCKDVDIVLHQAALGSVPRSLVDPIASHEHNVDAFLNLLVAARDANVRRMVYASSAAVYGDHAGLPKVEDRIGKPVSPYAATKRVDEVYAQVFQDVYGLPLIGLRYFNVFGRRQNPDNAYAPVIPRWIGHMLSGKPCVIYGDGTNSRDFCYVDNIVQCNLLSAVVEGDVTGTVYNCGCNEKTDLKRLFTLVRDNLAKAYPEVAKIEPVHEPPRKGDIAHSQAAIDKIAGALGYVPTHQVAEGMAETVAWYAQKMKRS